MRMRWAIRIAAVAALCASAVEAAIVNFDGTSPAQCSIRNLTDGTMTAKMGSMMICAGGSGCGTPGGFDVTATAPTRVEIGAPQLTASPTEFQQVALAAGAQAFGGSLMVASAGALETGSIGASSLSVKASNPDGGIASLKQVEPAVINAVAPSQFDVGFPGGRVELHSEIVDTAGLPAGQYRVSVAVSCTPL